MTGPEHYQEAEEMLRWAHEAPAQNDETNPAATLFIAAAQVHATLALTAATIAGAAWGTPMKGEDANQWAKVDAL